MQVILEPIQSRVNDLTDFVTTSGVASAEMKDELMNIVNRQMIIT